MKIYQKKFNTDFATIYYKEKKGEISCDCLAGMCPKGIRPEDRDFNLDGLPRHSEKYCIHAKNFLAEINKGKIETWKDVSPK